MSDYINSLDESLLKTLGVNKIKYEILKKILRKDNIKSMHIDLNSILDKVFNKLLKADIDLEECIYPIVSSIINTCAHYRQFFVSRFKINVPIYLYYVNKYENETISKILKILSIIIQYIDNIYYIDFELGIDVSMRYFVKKYNGGLIVTKNPLLYQLVNDSCDILRLSGDDSYVITTDNLYQKVSGMNDDFSSISTELYSIYLSLVGVKSLDYKGVPKVGEKKGINIIKNLLSKGKIINSHYSSADDFIKDSDNSSFNIIRRHYSDIDIRVRYKNLINNPRKKLLDNYIIDKFSKKDLKALNTTYFTGLNYLMLDELFMRVK